MDSRKKDNIFESYLVDACMFYTIYDICMYIHEDVPQAISFVTYFAFG